EGGVNVDRVRYTAAGNQINVSVQITIFGSGILDLNGFSDEIGPVTLVGGDISTGTGTVALGGTITSLPSTNSLSIISGHANLNATRAFNITNGIFSPDVQIDAEIIGVGGITKNGSGELSLNHSNSFAGLTTINAGILDVDDSFALGSTNSGTIVNNGGAVIVRSGSSVPLEPLTLNGTGFSSTTGALDGRFGSNAWAGTITLASDSTVSIINAPDILNLSGSITGPGGLTKTGAGTLIYSGGTLR